MVVQQTVAEGTAAFPVAVEEGDQPQVDAAAPDVIVIDRLVKQFEGVTGVDGLILTIRKGEMFGFLGPNGAGKTTTISTLCGLLAPTSGSARIGEFDISRERQKVKALIGICRQEAAVFKFLSGMENLELFGNLHGMDRKLIKVSILGG